jgi:nitrogen fixation protein
MDLARKHFEALGYTVETHGKPFDLLCTLGAEVLYVEVKGTQGSGAEILLTRGEVRFHRDHHANMALFVVSEVEVLADETASGGRLMLQNPWVLNEDELTPYAFRYRV